MSQMNPLEGIGSSPPIRLRETVYRDCDREQLGKMRAGALSLCRLFGMDPELVRSIRFRQAWIEFEVYVLDEDGGKQIEHGEPVTRLERFS